MTVLPFSCVQSSTSLARGPPTASCLDSEDSLRRDPSSVLASAFEPVAVAVLAKLRGQETAEKCERRISAVLSEAGCGIVRVALEAGDPAAEQLVLDDRPYYCAGKQRSRVMTSFGLVEYESNRYRRRNCETIAPADDRFGIPLGFWSPLAARHAALAMAMGPAKDCENLFRELGGMAPSATAPSGLIDPPGTVWEVREAQALEAIRAEEEVVAEAAAISVSPDGVMLGMRKEKGTSQQGDAPRPAGFREASSGTVSLHCGNPGEDGSLPRLRTVCFGRMPEAGKVSLKEDIAAEVRHLAQRRPDLPIVCIADGAPDNWSYFSEDFPDALQVLDFWHSAQHLKAAVDSAYGEGTPKAASRFEALRDTMRDGQEGIRSVIRSLERLARMHPSRKPIRRVLRFFRKNQQRMQYAEMNQKGLPIGSGPVEACNRVLVQQRMKCSGIRWSEYGTGQAILSFRALWKSGRFDAAWRQIMLALEPDTYTFRNRSHLNILKLENREELRHTKFAPIRNQERRPDEGFVWAATGQTKPHSHSTARGPEQYINHQLYDCAR